MRVVVADDSVLLREGIARLLEEQGFEVVGQAGDADDLVAKVAAHKPDVALVHTPDAAHPHRRRAPLVGSPCREAAGWREAAWS